MNHSHEHKDAPQGEFWTKTESTLVPVVVYIPNSDTH